MKSTAISYKRKSSASQRDNDGFPRQEKTIEDYASRHNITVVEKFLDDGISGTKSAYQRPGLSSALAFLTESDTKVLLVENASRIGRDLIISELIYSKCREIGVTVICCSSGQELSTINEQEPTQVLLRQLQSALAEWEKSMLVSKLKKARQSIRETAGRCEGKKPFGEANPGEEKTLQYIRKLARKPKLEKPRSYKKIADILNGETDHKTRHGKPWNPGSVRLICVRNGWRS